MSQVFSAQAPSNIAIVKYMGKKDSTSNLPENGSISVTLNDLCTLAELTEVPGSLGVRWVSEAPGAAKNWKPRHSDSGGSQALKPEVPALQAEGAAKITRYVGRVFEAATDLLPNFGLKTRDISGLGFLLRTANTFPQASGIASSASSFAAVTLIAAQASAENREKFATVFEQDVNFKRALAALSRRGSGSSCRSFEGPWVEWEDERAFAQETYLPKLAHFVVVVSDAPKAVSSSQAHLAIKTSPLWNGRVDRVNARLRELRAALRAQPSQPSNLAPVAKLAWGESWEMHSLFHTCDVPFTYWQPGSIEVLHWLSGAMKEDRPPIATMDAGPNVHILVDESMRSAWRMRLKSAFPSFRILEDGEGRGARLLPGEAK
jgi:diphosphomevalonate decarboxylase